MATRRSQLTFAAIRTEGGLLPPDLLDRIQKLDGTLDGLKPADYGLPPKTRVDSAIAEAWQAVLVHWASYRRTMERIGDSGGSGTRETRHWVQQVLYELGYGELRFVAAAETIGGRSFLISHRAGETETAPPAHIVTFRQDLDARTGRTGGGEQRGPHALMQGYLNTADHLWGVVTNGLVFRLLRENRQIDRTSRVDFDLEGMLEAESFAEFRLFWLMLHRSRLLQPSDQRDNAWLERWTRVAVSEGTRALSGLRDGVEDAIEALGQGLLNHPDNHYLRERLASGTLSVDAYYGQLLRLIYRVLFLLVAEERQLLFPRPATGGQTAEGRAARERSITRYRKHYSIERLREEASRVRNRETHHDDLWRGLLVTFDAMRFPDEAHALGLEPLGGGLFGANSCPDVADDAAPGTVSGDRTAGRPLLTNAALLDAIQALSEVTRDGITRRINYRDLDVEELGSVYEGLLEHRPALTPRPNDGYQFGFSQSTSRKETGSYYTPRGLVQELLTSALDPVIDAALARATTPEAKARALLDLNVCDPACGSGHFLLGAARRIGRRLAEVRAGTDREPEPPDLRHATAEAIRHCAYGVDKNLLAIDLCKVALWIESHEPGGPIGFLDHHVKRGDSLVGVFHLDVLEMGIPDDAYKPVTGDEKSVAADLKKRNKAERAKLTVQEDGRAALMHPMSLFSEGKRADVLKALGDRLREIDAMPEETAEAVRAKAAAYERVQGRPEWQTLAAACDLWTRAFFAPLTTEQRHLVPTSETVRQMMATGNVPANITGEAMAASKDVGFFHWRLAFPDVFGWEDGAGGFDCVLGNPPWERIKLQEQEFFETRDPEIAKAPNAAARSRRIKQLQETTPALFEAFQQAKQTSEAASIFLRQSGRFPLTGRGDINTYSVFAELMATLPGRQGRGGVIVPTGIATDDTNKQFFGWLVRDGRLVSIFDFENREAVFPGVHRSYKFSLLTMAGAARPASPFSVAFSLTQPGQIHEPENRFELSAADIELLNPNTLTCPIFRSARDAAITKQLYEAAPVLVREGPPEVNPWGITFKTLFHMSNDSHLFRTRSELEDAGCQPGEDGRFRAADGGAVWLPLYEAKLIHQFDHRFATYAGANGAEKTRDLTPAEHADPSRVILPRYWVAEREVERAVGTERGHHPGWFLGFRDIARNTDERTAIFSLVPWAGVGHKLPLIVPQSGMTQLAAFLANFNSLVLDYGARQKVGGTSLGFFIMRQLPVLPPETYTPALLDQIVPRVLELTYTAHDLAPFARDLGHDGPPFIWDEARRAELRAELDGIYAHLYNLSRDDFAYILDQFPIVRRNDERDHGEFRTKRLCLAAYDHVSPETLRHLELAVRAVEVGFRQLIDRALDGNIDALPPAKKEKLLDFYGRGSRANGTGPAPTLRDLLEWTTFEDLDPILRSDLVWLQIGPHFASKRKLGDALGALRDFRNPLAHSRGLREDERVNGEQALATFQAVLRARG